MTIKENFLMNSSGPSFSLGITAKHVSWNAHDFTRDRTDWLKRKGYHRIYLETAVTEIFKKRFVCRTSGNSTGSKNCLNQISVTSIQHKNLGRLIFGSSTTKYVLRITHCSRWICILEGRIVTQRYVEHIVLFLEKKRILHNNIALITLPSSL